MLHESKRQDAMGLRCSALPALFLGQTSKLVDLKCTANRMAVAPFVDVPIM